jgi:hypothetical protein
MRGASLTMRGASLVVILLAHRAHAFSVLDIEGGGPSSSLGVGGGSDLFVVGTDLGDPFNPPVVLVGNNPNPSMTTCAVESFTSQSSRFHCIVGGEGLPTQDSNVGSWGRQHTKLLRLHVIVDGREAMCDNGKRIEGTGVGDCLLRFDVGATPLVTSISTPVIQSGELLRVRALSRESLGAQYGRNTTVQLVRGGGELVGCPMFEADTDNSFYEQPSGLAADESVVGCRVESDPASVAGFFKVQIKSLEQNRGRALVAPSVRRVDLASNTLYDVEAPPRISSVKPSAISPSGAASLTIAGSGFGGSLADLEVTAAGVACEATALENGRITCSLAALDSARAPSVGDRGIRFEWWTTEQVMPNEGLMALRKPNGVGRSAGSLVLQDFEAPIGTAASHAATALVARAPPGRHIQCPAYSQTPSLPQAAGPWHVPEPG